LNWCKLKFFQCKTAFKSIEGKLEVGLEKIYAYFKKEETHANAIAAYTDNKNLTQ